MTMTKKQKADKKPVFSVTLPVVDVSDAFILREQMATGQLGPYEFAYCVNSMGGNPVVEFDYNGQRIYLAISTQDIVRQVIEQWEVANGIK